MACRRTAGAEQPFEFERRNHVGVIGVGIGVEAAGVEGLEARRKYNRSHFQIQEELLLLVVYGIGGTDFGADTALFPLAQLAAIFGVDGVTGGNRLSVILIDGFTLAESCVVIIQHYCGALFRTDAAGNTLVRIDVSGLLANLDLEMPFFAVDFFELGIGEQIDVQVPADLDQLG